MPQPSHRGWKAAPAQRRLLPPEGEISLWSWSPPLWYMVRKSIDSDEEVESSARFFAAGD
jgi:hypothetical protein